MSRQDQADVLNDLISTFAHPFPGPDDSVLAALTVSCTSISIARALQFHGAVVTRRSPGLTEVLGSWMDARQRTFWDPLLGRLREVRETDPPESCYLILIECGLRALLDGVPGGWPFQLATPARFRLGPWVLPHAISGQVDASGCHISLDLKDADGSLHRLNLHKANDGHSWKMTSSALAVELPSVSFSTSETVLLPDHMMSGQLLPDLPGSRFLEVSELAQVAERLRRARDVVSEHSPQYANWIDRSVSCMAPMKSANQSSGSHPSFPGLLVMSDDPRPAAIAEMLVHEASHQYFYIATMLGPVDDGSDSQEYYSPLVRRPRPIDKVLLSYHAMGNMIILLKHFVASGIDDAGYCRDRLECIAPQIQEVDEALHRTNSLTELGDALWRPLSNRLAQPLN